ncbi:hypothetical protein SCB49_14350 [unidentified eubacterium SCB49]|nr:hypothetical protein SCB49_14350 [unidentified eubacterium SCB49]
MVDNEFSSPIFLLKAGVTALDLGKPSVAVKHLTTLTEKYPNAAEATKATAYLGMAEAMN